MAALPASDRGGAPQAPGILCYHSLVFQQPHHTPPAGDTELDMTPPSPEGQGEAPWTVLGNVWGDSLFQDISQRWAAACTGP